MASSWTVRKALKNYPMLEFARPLDLVVMRHGAIETKDEKFQAALDALLKSKTYGVESEWKK